MIIYKSTKQEFVSAVLENRIADKINDVFFKCLGRNVSKNEYISWKNSMMYMNNIVNTADIPDETDVAIEYNIPLMSKRIDFILCGQDIEKQNQLIIIELKQWTKSSLTSMPGLVRTRFAHGEKETVHPSYQAWSYAAMLKDYNESVIENKINIQPCAYLHNYERDNIIDNIFYEEYIKEAPIFCKTDAVKLQNFIKKHIKFKSKIDLLYTIEKGRLKPSKFLADSLVSMLAGNKEFTLLDDQKVVYETALQMMECAIQNKKQVLIVEGGPGTGKSVLAINLLVEFTKRNLVAKYVSKNSAPRAIYSSKLQGSYKKAFINNLFVGSGCFIDTESDVYDSLIVDEAHRLNLKSGLFSNLGNNQISEIINSAKLSIFFVDDKQRIHIKDIGSKKEIEAQAISCGAQAFTLQLSSQFRCNGSDGYLAWLDNALQIKETANITLSQEDYDFRIFDNPKLMFDEIQKKNLINNKSRVVAGYCWNWVSKNNLNLDDINFPEYNFNKKWNLKSDGSNWLIAENSINEIGCIHTCQGLELDYVGVIVGNDIFCNGDSVLTDVRKRSSGDRSIHGFQRLLRTDKEKAIQDSSEIIKNTYRTLMTRGMKGCYVYFCDANLAEHFKNLLLPANNIEDVSDNRIEYTINDSEKYLDFLPIYSLRAACGYFGNGEVVEELGWIKVENHGRLNRNMFIVKARGNSMQPKINDGDYCLFKRNYTGSPNGKILLIEHFDYVDPENSGSYSIKKYKANSVFNEDNNQQNTKITLEPLNKDYNKIILNEYDNTYRIIGEFVEVL